MADTQSRKKTRLKFRHILVLLGVIGLLVLVLLDHKELTSFVHLIRHVRWYILVVIVGLQAGSYFLNGLYYRSILRMFGYDVGIRRLFEGALATNFVNYILPSVGLAGAGYLSQVLYPDVPRGQGALTQLTRYAFSALAVLVMIPVGFLLVLNDHHVRHRIVSFAFWSVIGIIALAAAIIVLIQREKWLRRSVAWVEHRIGRFLPKHTTKDIDHFIDEFYVGYRDIAEHKKGTLIPFGWSILYILVEMLTFYMAFLAFGHLVSPGIAIMAYLFANIVSIFGGVLISTGSFELSMVGTLVLLGTPLTLAIAVTTVYRVLNLIIGLPPGFIYYRKYLT